MSTGKPEFTLAEMLVLLDIDVGGAAVPPMPTPTDAAPIANNAFRGVAPCVELHGACRFSADLYAPPHAELVVSPVHALVAITRFHDADVWTGMYEWVTSYLGDTLTPTAGAAREGFAEFAGNGVIATVGYVRPSVRVDPRELVIEVSVRRDEPAVATLHHLFGVAPDVRIAPPDDGNWRELATKWPMHLECSSHVGARFRFSAPHHDKQTSTASLCEEWAWRWLDLCARTAPGHHDRTQLGWNLAGRGHASIVRGDGGHRRDTHELHVPAAWLAH